jgi:hypothetical protein
MALAELKSVQAYARQVNDDMKKLTQDAHEGRMDLQTAITLLLGGVATLAAQIEVLANHLVDGLSK